MKLRLFNTRTHTLEDFAPFDSETARIYSCGPTVYNFAHIGNLSSYIYADILRRAIELDGFATKHVMNLTDVDDKTIRDSRAEFPDDEPKIALKKLTTKYAKIFMDEMRAVGNSTEAITFDRATANIGEIEHLIRELLRKKVAYIADDGIYFSIAEYKKTRVYGQLSQVNFAENRRARVRNDEYDKDAAQDFALWKFAKPGEPKWNFSLAEFRDDAFFRENFSAEIAQNADEFFANFGAGRPGWHIECSVMSTKNLGQPFDIHTGGVDLIFPHHENEIAQSTAAGQPELLANFFVHSEHLLVDGKKMSKSAHNFYVLGDLEKRGFDPLDFRMLVLESHYRSATNFSWTNLAAAKSRRKKWRNVAELRWQIRDDRARENADFSQKLETEKTFHTGIDAHLATSYVGEKLKNAKTSLLNDLDTPGTLAAIDKVCDFLLPEKRQQNWAPAQIREDLETLINFVDKNLGLELRATTPDISDEEKDLIREREAARTEKNWAKSDEIRDELLAQNIELRDTSDGTIWSQK